MIENGKYDQVNKLTQLTQRMVMLRNKLAFRQALLVLTMLIVFGIAAYFAGIVGQNPVTAQAFVDLQEGEFAHTGFRRAHAKGICISGTFESTGALESYSVASVFSQVTTPFLGRFSIAGNNPTAPDLKAPVRSLAFALPSNVDQQWRVAMNTPPVMAVATPEAFFQAHPESKAFNDWKAKYVPTNSFATEHYHSINAFYLVDKKGNRQAVRWEAVPQVAHKNMPVSDAKSPDALQNQLSKLLLDGPVGFSLIFTLANATDDENNPTIPWPSQRKKIIAGTLVINAWEAQETGACAGKNFDPLVLPDGILSTADPILRARSAAYAESFRRRAKETLLNSKAVN